MTIRQCWMTMKTMRRFWEAPTVVANSGPCHHQARKKKAEEEALLFERFKLLVQKGQSSLEQERPQPAAEHASSSSAAASSHQPRDLLQPCAKRKERKRNRREMDEDTGVWERVLHKSQALRERSVGEEERPWWEEQVATSGAKTLLNHQCLVLFWQHYLNFFFFHISSNDMAEFFGPFWAK